MRPFTKVFVIGITIIATSCVVKNSYIPYYEKKNNIESHKKIDAKLNISVNLLKYTPKWKVPRKLGLSEQEFKNFISDDFTDLFTNDPTAKDIYAEIIIESYDHILSYGGMILKVPFILLSLIGSPWYFDNIVANVQLKVQTEDTLLYSYNTIKKRP